ncbi:MFS transporter [Caulobacter sp. S45]|uniref:MFS transporter n=1 Tax=Caulobacter sp. S45 TaxID=1641861 RepID=UPI001575D514|nr:MFS transporter [Caulobacter sp. S45]
MTSRSPVTEAPARWSELLRGPRALTFGVLCLGVWLNAVDALVTATIMPSVARDIGGYAYFAWATAGFMLGSILAGAGAGLLAQRMGLRHALAACGLLYATGCVVSALAGSIWPFLLGRLLQGGGAGFVMGLCYVAVRGSFPERMWSSIFAILSGVWGVATLLGPLVGGLFASAHLWRGVFWVFAAQAAAFALATLGLLRIGPEPVSEPRRLPGLQLLMLTAAVALIAVAGVVHRPAAAGLMVAAGLALLLATLRVDAGADLRLLPAQASDFGSWPGQGYAAVLLLSASAIGFSVYGAALLQARLGLTPLQAGYAVASESIGWTVTALLVARAPARLRGMFIRLGAATAATGLAACALTLSSAGVALICASAMGMGGGFGLCWSFIAQRVLNALPDDEAAIGSSAIPMTQILGNAIGSAAASVLANLLGLAQGFSLHAAAAASPILLGAFLPVALLAVLAAWRLGSER